MTLHAVTTDSLEAGVKAKTAGVQQQSGWQINLLLNQEQKPCFLGKAEDSMYRESLLKGKAQYSRPP